MEPVALGLDRVPLAAALESSAHRLHMREKPVRRRSTARKVLAAAGGARRSRAYASGEFVDGPLSMHDRAPPSIAGREYFSA